MTETVGKMLERLGYHVTAKLSSLEALDLFREDPAGFDLIITDMTMPKMTGDQLAKEVLQIRSDMPIILCTGHSDKINEKKVKEIGINTFILKMNLQPCLQIGHNLRMLRLAKDLMK